MAWQWNKQREDAAAHVFEGVMTRAQIAEAVGVSLWTIKDWLAEPEFKARVKELGEQYRQYLYESGIPFVRRESRVAALSQMAADAREEWELHRYMVEQRPVPGGMLVNERLNVDAANVFRGCLSDVSKELGERTTKIQMDARVDVAPLQVTTVQLSDELVSRYLRSGEDVARLVSGEILDAETSDDEDADAQDNDAAPTALFNLRTHE